MKLFGGKKDKSGVLEEPKREKKPKRKLTKRQIRRRILIGAVVAATLCVASVAAWKTWVQPPSIADSIMADNDSSVMDQDNGDAINISGADRKENYFTFLVCATDEVAANTDSIMVVSFDVANHKVNVMNVPRDTMSDCKRSNKKINGAYYKGIDNTKKELQQLLGFEADKYMVVDFKGIADIVDAIGGVDYDIPIKMNYDDPAQDLSIHFNPGMQHLNGEQTVEFLRFRKSNNGGGYITGDIGRVENQQKFLKTLAQKMLNPLNVVKVPKISEAVFKHVKTDITMGQMIWLGLESMKVDSVNIEMHTLPGHSQYVNGLSYYVADEAEVLTLVNQCFNPYKTDITDLDILLPSKESTSTSPRKSSASSRKKAEDEEEQKTKIEKETEEAKTETDSDKPKDSSGQTDTKTNPKDETKSETNTGTNTQPKTDTGTQPKPETKPAETPQTPTPTAPVDPEMAP